MTLGRLKLLINILAIILLMVSLISYHIVTVQAFILIVAIKFIPGFFLPKHQSKKQ
ncbi:hypothetical protein [Periweissella fabalis]|uniref:Uncharacterized protein n=1 Tax=Periweissella fabalis TaxID=1070421 RepID=A0A7X6N272_9LACO|nr:hypothetical protein [Periweissella fabalis]MCM0599451.1 hypothetical protein [Periweissella fabalis]NKZ23730.1 hypothetical protein [Periweissella fabalis]